MPMADALDRFRAAIAAAGLTPPDRLIADGRLRRFATNARRGDSAGWYVLRVDGSPAGAFGPPRRLPISTPRCAISSIP